MGSKSDEIAAGMINALIPQTFMNKMIDKQG